MDRVEYQKVRDELIFAMGHQRLYDREKELRKRVAAECTAQQKSAITRMSRTRNDELDYNDMYYSQF